MESRRNLKTCEGSGKQDDISESIKGFLKNLKTTKIDEILKLKIRICTFP